MAAARKIPVLMTRFQWQVIRDHIQTSADPYPSSIALAKAITQALSAPRTHPAATRKDPEP